MNPDKRDELYNNLINSGKVGEAEIGSLDDFKAAITDEESARLFHQNLMGSGIFGEDEIGSEDDFYSSISSDFAGTAAPQQPATTSATTPSTPARGTAFTPYTMQPTPVRAPFADAQATQQYEQQKTTSPTQPTAAQNEQEQPLGPERFAKQMQMDQQLGQMSQSLTNRMEYLRKQGRPFGRNEIDALAPARQKRVAEEDLQRAMLPVSQSNAAVRNAWVKAAFRTEQERRLGRFVGNEAARLKYHDLDRMSDEAWNSIDDGTKQRVIRNVAQVLREDYGMDYAEARSNAEKMVRSESDKMMFDEAVKSGAPKNWLDYLTRKINENAFANILEGWARSKAGTTGDMLTRETAEEQYRKENWLGGLSGDVLGFAFRPENLVFGGIAGGAAKGTASILGRKTAEKLIGKMAQQAVSSGLNLGLFFAGDEAGRQFKYGGAMKEDGTIGDYDLDAVGKSALKGGLTGVVIGPTGQLIGNVGTRLTRATSSTVGKTAVRGGQALTNILAEGTIFVAPEMLKGELTFDDWLGSIAMMAGFKLQGGLKSAPERLMELSGKRGNGRQGFETRMRTMLDRDPNIALTKDEEDELERGGYNDLKELVKDYKQTSNNQRKAIETKQPVFLEPNAEGEIPYNRFIELVEDKNISEAARAKMYYYITGHGLPMSTVLGSTFTEHKDAKGNVTGYEVQSLGLQNGVITSRTFKNRKEAELELERINRQAELNGVAMGEQAYDNDGDRQRMLDAYDVVAKRKGLTGENAGEILRKKLQRNSEELNQQEKSWAQEVAEVYDRLPREDYQNADKLREDIDKKYNVDINNAVSKEPNRRNESEQKAFEEYVRRLVGIDNKQAAENVIYRNQITGGSAETTYTDAEAAGTDVDQRAVGSGLYEGGAGAAQGGGDGVDIGSLTKGLAAERYGDIERGSREKQASVGHQIIENAKSNGLFIERSSLGSYGERKRKPSGESVIYEDIANNRVVKVKDPYAKTNLKGHAAEDALYEHIVHNLLFPNSKYRLLGISEGPIGDVRLVLEQDYLGRGYEPATQDQIDKYLTEVLGLTKVEKPYLHYENDYYSIADVDAGDDNVLVGEDGELHFIDPIIKFKKPGKEVVKYLGGSVDDNRRESENGAWQQGYDADEQSRKDIAIALSMQPDNAEHQAAWEGVMKRIEDEADFEMAMQREAYSLQRNDDDGSLHPATMNIDGQQRQVFIKSGLITTAADGSIDTENSGETIVVYDPVEGKSRMVSPADIAELGEVVSQDQFEADLQNQRADLVQQQQDAATGRFNPKPGDEVAMPDGNKAFVMAVNGDNVTLQLPDGTQQDMSISDIQQIADGVALNDYRQRHPDTAAETTIETATTDSRPLMIEGHPDTYEPGMQLTIQRDGEEPQQVTVTGIRARWNPTVGYVEDPNGRFVQVQMSDGSLSYIEADDPRGIITGYMPAPQEEPWREYNPDWIDQGNPPDDGGTPPPPAPPAAVGNLKNEEEPTETIQPIQPINAMPMRQVKRKVDGKMTTVEEEDWMATTPARAYQYLYEEAVSLGLPVETADNLVQANLKAAQKDIERAKKAVGSVISVLQKQNAAQAAVDYWQQVTDMRKAVVDAEQKELANNEPAEEPLPLALQQTIDAASGNSKALLEQAAEEMKNDPGALSLLEDTTPLTLEELIPGLLLGKSSNTPRLMFKDEEVDGRTVKGFSSMSGYSWDDVRQLPGIWAKHANGGLSLEQFGELLEQTARDNSVLFDENDPMAGLNAALAFFGEVKTLGDMYDYTIKRRIGRAEEYHTAALSRAEDDWIAAHDGLTRAEHEGWIAYFEEQAAALNGQKYEDYYNKIAESTLNNHDTRIATDLRGGREAGTGALQGQEGLQTTDTRDDSGGAEGSGSRDESGTAESAVAERIAAAEAQTDTNPTEGQKKAGNYAKGHLTLDGYNISIEQPKGSIRRGVDADGRAWEQEMHNTYGYIRGTEGVDGDHIDVFLSDDPTQGNVFVIDQVNKDGSFDEHKVMYGFPDAESARAAYLSNYEEGWQGLGTITEVSKDEFKKWFESSHRKTKPFSEYKSVEKLGGQNEVADEEALASRMEVDYDGETTEEGPNGTIYRRPIVIDGIHRVEQVDEPDEKGHYTGSYYMYNGKRYGDLPGVFSYIDSNPAPKEEASITPTQYTTKKGKVLDMQLVKFDKELTKEQFKAAKEIARKSMGWWSAADGGFLMRSEDAARQLVDSMSDKETVADEQPVSLVDMNTVADVATMDAIDEAAKEEEKPQSTPQYNPDREDEAYETRLKSLHDQYKDTLPTVQALERKIRGFENRAKLIEEELANATDDNDRAMSQTRLANINGYARAHRTFLDEVRKRNVEKNRDNALAAHGVKLGDKIWYKGKEATIYDADARTVVLDTGMAPVIYEQTEWGNVNVPQVDTPRKDGADSNRKTDNQADAVTYDDQGNVIPLSKRFDKRNADIRYQKAENDGEIKEMSDRISQWLSDENIEKSKGKSREEIIDMFGNDPQPIAIVPDRFLQYIGDNIADSHVYSGMGYFIDHAVNHHPTVDAEKYQNIQKVLNNPDEVKSIKDNGNDSIAFIKQIDRYNAVVIEVEKTKDGKIIWHKSFYDQKKKPYANKGVQLYNVSSGGGVSPIIRTDESAHDGSLSVLDDVAKVQQNSETAKNNLQDAENENGEQADNADVLMREGDRMARKEVSYDEALASAKAAGYTKKQFDAMLERRRRNVLNAKEALADWTEKLHLTDKITFVESVDEVEGLTDKQREQRRDKKGWYLPKSDKIVIVLGNHRDQSDVLKTILHEGVAHHGLRAMFGQHFDDFLDNVYAAAEYPVREQIAKLAKNHGWNIRTATEEYLAGLAEDTNFEEVENSPFAGWWTKIKKFFFDMLRKLGIKDAFTNANAVFSDNELRYILWRSYQNLVNPGRYRSFVDTANDVVMQDKLKVGNYEETSGEKGAWYEPAKAAESTGVDKTLRDLKRNNPDMLLLEDKGDHYEARGEDAKRMADILGVKPSSKGVLSINSDDIDNAMLRMIRGVLRVATYRNMKAAEDEVLFRSPSDDSSLDDPLNDNSRAMYEQLVGDSVNQFTEAMQDSMKSLESLMKAVLGDKNLKKEDVSAFENPYLVNNAMSSATHEQTKVWHNYFIDPLKEEIRGLIGKVKGKKEWQAAYTELVNYMMAKHGLERNEVFAIRDAKEDYRNEYDATVRDISALKKRITDDLKKKLTDGTIDEQAYNTEINKYERDFKRKRKELEQERDEKIADLDTNFENDSNFKKYRSRDYAGLTALTKKEDVEKAEIEAMRMVMDYEAKHDTKALWQKINAATNSTLVKLADSGIMSAEQFERTRDMFQFYIPLQGFNDTVAEDLYAYMGGKGMLGVGSLMKHAKGRKSKADDPLATIIMNGEAAIRQGNRNLMKQKFLNFVLNHPSKLVSVHDIWLHKNDTTGQWERYFEADLREDDSPEVVARKMQAFEDKMTQLAAEKPDEYKRGRELPDVPYRVVEKKDMDQHQVLIRRNGQTVVLTINGNPRAAQALNGLTNPDVDTEKLGGKIINGIQAVTRFLATNYTSRFIDFMAANWVRDAFYSNDMAIVRENAKYARKFHKEHFKTMPVNTGILFKEWENGKLQEKIDKKTANKYELYFREFMLNGGETGWTNIRDLEQHKRDLERELRHTDDLNVRAWKAFTGFLDIANRAVENNARFAAYVTSREAGRSIVRSVWDAKEVSVNFNTKGSGSKMAGAVGQTKLGNVGSVTSGIFRTLFPFWNASVQGLSNIYRSAKRRPGRFALRIFAVQFLMGAVIPLISQWLCGDDDDDENNYYNLPEYVRRSNLCFRFSKNMPWITLPLPIEFRAPYGLGELTMGLITGNEHYTTRETLKQYASQFSEVLPLDFLEGGGGWHVIMPGAVKPALEAHENESWSGLPIYKESVYDPNLANWTKGFSNTSQPLTAATRWLNQITADKEEILQASGNTEHVKGFIDWNPAVIEYLMRGYLGGLYTTANQFIKVAETIAGSREFEWRNIPVANRFIKEGDERTAARKLQNEYFHYIEEYEGTKARLKDGDKENLSAEQQQERQQQLSNIDSQRHYWVIDAYKPLLDDLHKQKQQESEYSVVEIEELENTLRRQMVDLIHAVDKNEEMPKDSIDKQVDEMLMQNFERGGYTRHPAANQIAKRLGGRDSYGTGRALDTDYGKVYERTRDYVDLAEDVLLQVAIREAKEQNDVKRQKDLESNRDDINTVKKHLGNPSADVDDVMKAIREKRREALNKFHIDYDGKLVKTDHAPATQQ